MSENAMGQGNESLNKYVERTKKEKGKFFIWLSILFVMVVVYINVSAFSPGIYTYDSVNQLSQAINGKFVFWHPPLMAWFWSKLIVFTEYDDSLFFFHMILLFLSGLSWVLLFKRLGFYYFSVFIPLSLLSPIIVNFSGVVWKDVGFAYTMLLSSSLVGFFIYDRKNFIYYSLFIILLLFYGVGVRLNGATAIIPFFWLFTCYILEHFIKKISLKKFFLCLSITISFLFVFLGLIVFFEFKISEPSRINPFDVTETWDLMGISKISKKNYFPPFIRIKTFESMIEKYKTSISLKGFSCNIDQVFQSSKMEAYLYNDPRLQNQLRRYWIRGIMSEPIAYINHRINVSKCLLMGSYTYESPQSPQYLRTLLIDQSLNLKRVKFLKINFPFSNEAKNIVLYLVSLWKGTFFFTLWFWLTILLFQFLLSSFLFLKNNIFLLTFIISLSGLLYAFPYFLITPSTDFRYVYWTTISAFFNTILISAYFFSQILAPQKNLLVPSGTGSDPSE